MDVHLTSAPKFIVDECVTHVLAEMLRDVGYDAVAVREVGLRAASDLKIVGYARNQGRVVITEDTDYGKLLALSGYDDPSIVRLADLQHLDVEPVTDRLLVVLPDITDDLETGAVVTITEHRVRVTRLPLGG